MDVQDQLRVGFDARHVGADKTANPAPYFAFPRQNDVVKLVSRRVERLQAGGLGAGANSVTILGERGCGKTATLQAVGCAIEAVRPDIVYAYVDVSLLRPFEHPLRSVLDRVESTLGLELSGPEVRHDQVFDRLNQVLQEHNKKVMIVFDEFDKFYAQHLWTQERKSEVEKSLLDIFALEVVQVAAHVHCLVQCVWVAAGIATRGSVPTLVNAFPVLKLGVHLNGSSFRARVLRGGVVDADLVRKMEAAIRHLWQAKMLPLPFSCGIAHSATTEAVFWRAVATGACLLVGPNAGCLSAFLEGVANRLDDAPISSNATPTAAEAATIKLLHDAYRYSPGAHGIATSGEDVGFLKRWLSFDEDYAGVVPCLWDEFRFAWASKNQLPLQRQHTPDNLTRLMQRLDAGNLQPLAPAEFAAVWNNVRANGRHGARQQVGSNAVDCLHFMVRHHLLLTDPSGGLWPSRMFDATLAPQGVVSTLAPRGVVATWWDSLSLPTFTSLFSRYPA